MEMQMPQFDPTTVMLDQLLRLLLMEGMFAFYKAVIYAAVIGPVVYAVLRFATRDYDCD